MRGGTLQSQGTGSEQQQGSPEPEVSYLQANALGEELSWLGKEGGPCTSLV